MGVHENKDNTDLTGFPGSLVSRLGFEIRGVSVLSCDCSLQFLREVGQVLPARIAGGILTNHKWVDEASNISTFNHLPLTHDS